MLEGSKPLKPHAGEANPRAAKASQTPPDGGITCPKGSKNQRMILAADRQNPLPTSGEIP